MPNTAITTGVLMIIIGLIGFVPSGAKTALIPAYIGAVIAICGAIATKPAYRMHAMRGSVVVALLAFIMVGWRLIKALLSGTFPPPLALFCQIAAAVVTGVFVVLCVRSFSAARRSRQAAG